MQPRMPTAQADQLTFAPKNPDNQYTATQYPNGCMFACHYVSTLGDASRAYQGFNYAEIHNLKLRIDSLAGAVLNLLNYAMQPGTAMFPNQYQIGVYPFITDAIDAVPLAYLSSSLPVDNFEGPFRGCSGRSFRWRVRRSGGDVHRPF